MAMKSDKFSFVLDEKIKVILERDYSELQNLNPEVARKSVIVLSGGIIEGLLIDALIVSEELTFKDACKKNFFELIQLAKSKKIITEDILSNSIRNYRNLVHPAKEIRDEMLFDSTDAKLASAGLEIIIRDVKKWMLAQEKLRKLELRIIKATNTEREFLSLFASPKPLPPNQFEHPWLKYDVYIANRTLIKDGFLQQVEDDSLTDSQERFCLVTDAKEIIEKHIVKGKLQRDTIIIDLSNVAASGMSGSGSPSGGTYRHY